MPCSLLLPWGSLAPSSHYFGSSFLGLPSRVVGIPLTILLLLTAGILLLKRRPVLNLGMFMPVVFATVLGLISVGWPAMKYGLEWTSFGNDDMANYLLEAQVWSGHGISGNWLDAASYSGRT